MPVLLSPWRQLFHTSTVVEPPPIWVDVVTGMVSAKFDAPVPASIYLHMKTSPIPISWGPYPATLPTFPDYPWGLAPFLSVHK